MYEYNGRPITLEQIQSAAQKSNLSVEEYIAKAGIVTKSEEPGKTTSQGQGAPVAGTAAPEVQAEGTDSTLEDGSLELEEISLEEKKSLPYSVRNRISSTNGDFSRGNVNSILKTLNLKKLDVKDFETKKINENYDKEYAIFKENQEDPARMTALREAKIDLLAPRIDKTILKSKLNQALVDVEITSDEMQETKRQEIYGMAIAADKYLSQDLPADIIKAYSKEINIKRDQLSNKYDLTTQEGFDKANNEYNAFIDNVVQAGWNSNQTAQERNALLLNTLGEVLSLKATNYTRKTELGLGPLDDNYTKGETMEEGLKKGARQIKGSVEKSIAAGILENINNLQDELNNLPINENEVVSFGGTEMPRQGIVSGGKSGTVKEAKKFYENKILELKKDALSKVVNVKEEEKIQQAFRQASLTDGNVTLDDILLLASEQALQLPLAALTYGVGTFAQEFGTSYFDNIDAYIENNKLNPALKEQLKKKEITQEEYDSALNALRTPENILEASEKGGGSFENALAVGIGNSALEYIGASTIAKGIFGKEAAKKGITSLVNDGFKKYIKSKTLQGSVENITKSGFVEFLTESFQTASSQLGKGASVDDPFKYINIEEIKESAVSGGVIGALFPFAAGGSKATFRESINTAKKIAANFNEEATSNYLDLAIKEIKQSNVLSAVEKEQQLEAVAEVRNANVKIPSFIKGDAKVEALNLIIEKKSLEKIISEADPNLVVEEKARVEEINKKIQDVAVKSKITELGEKDIAQAKKITEQLPELKTVVKDFNTTAELEEELKNQGKSEAEAKKLSDDFGFIVQKKDGTQEIYINKEISFDSGVATTAQHEVLHSVLKNLIPGNIALGQNLKDFVEEIAGDGFMGTEFSKRFESYELQYEDKINQLNSQLEKNEISEDEFSTKAKSALENMWEETMPLLSESLTRGDIDSKATIFEKLKDFFNRIFNTSNIKNVKFNTGEDVFNFIKDYNKIYKSGRGIKTLKNVVQGQVEGELISNKKAEIEEVVKSSSRELASDKVQKIYDEQGIAGIYEIMDEYKPMAKKIAEKYRDRPGFTTYKEDLVTGILDDPTYGVMGLALKYNPQENEGVPLAAYINKYLAARSITIANQLLGKDEASTFKSDVAEVKDVTATETAEDAILASEEIAKEKPKTKKKLISEQITFNNELDEAMNNALKKGIALNIKKFDIETTKNRTITPFIADLKKDLSDFLEKDLVKFIKSEGLDSFLISNRETLLDNLTTTFLSKHPFFRKGILKRVNREWVAPTKINTYKYDWIDSKGDKLKIDRDNAAGRGMTSGPEFIKRNPKIKEIVKENEFVDYHFQDGALRNKAKQNPVASIARQIAAEKGFEILKDDLLNNGDLTKTIKERADLYGIIISEVEGQQIAKDIDRGIVKFSKKVEFESNSAKFSKKFNNARKLVIKVGIDGQKYNDYIASLPKEEGRLIHDRINDMLGAIQEMSDIEASNQGIKFEEVVKKIISKNPELEGKISIIYNPNQGGSSNQGQGDLTLDILGTKINFELKLNENALMGSFTAKLKENGEIEFTKESPVNKKIAEYLNKNKEARYNYIKRAKEILGSNAKNYDLKVFPPKLPEYVYSQLRNEGLQNKVGFTISNSKTEINIPNNLISEFYLDKGVDYIQVGNIGLFHTGNNPLNLPIPAFNFNTKITARMTSSSSQKKGQEKLYSGPIRIFMKLDQSIPLSNMSLVSNSSLKAIMAMAEEQLNKDESIKSSKKTISSMNTTINEMIERKKGILATETISEATAKLQGAKKGKGKIFVPPSADDLVGLLYNFLGTGKQGDADMAFFEEKLLKPLARANFDLNKERQFVKQGYHNLIKANKGINKKLRKESDYKYYTNDAAVRVFMWTRLGYDIPGINAADKKALINAVLKDKDLLKFAEELISVPSKKESWLQPEDAWTASTIEMDLQEILSKIGRARIFEEYITNANIIFSKDNINKIEAAYGPSLRNALEDMLYRIEKGRAREIGTNKMANTYLNWVRGSVATTMFFNMRSALLQQLSIVNFTNWEDNNIFAQGKFIATKPKEYARYWVKIFNSDWMKERRQGLKTDINESELVARLEGSKNKNKALLAYILEKGFSLTKYGDNIAIATGGAPFLYNREQKYIKEGMTEAKAKEEAFLDFQELAERTQQSSRQDLLSNQQVSVIGRIFLAFQNTTMQMTRLQKKAVLDIINKRGSFKANVSRLVYYGAIQNSIFSFLQSALFAAFFTDDEEEKDELKIDNKTFRAINTVLDSALRGSGIGGAALSTLKNATIAWMRENDKGFTGQNGKVILELLNISPAVGIKARKIYGAMENYKFNKKILDKIGYDNPNHPYYGIAGNLASAAFNIPLDRIVTKASNIKAMTQQDAEAWQRTALFMGYNTWDLGLKDPEIEAAKNKSKKSSPKRGLKKKGFGSGLKKKKL